MPEPAAPWVLALPAAVAVGLLWLGSATPGFGVPTPGSVRRTAAPWRRALAAAPGGARVAAVALLAWVAASPVRTVVLPPEPGEGVALVVALDVSESMGDPGLGGRRKIDVAVDEIRRFAATREGDALGLVTFAEEALARVPPTVDRQAFLDALGRVRAGELGDGTAVGTALALAANRLRAVDARSRVLVLVTDGRNNAGSLDPVTAARAATALGQRLYVLEVADGEAEEPGLRQVAVASGGLHFTVSDRQALDDAYREIGDLEPSRLPGAPRTARVPASAGLLWWVLALLALERGLGAGRLGRLG